MKNYLLITLGHNSSAIFVENSESQKIIGYEQERLSRIKADSQFPMDAINEIEKNVGFNTMKGCTILISHWFEGATAPATFNKYFTERGLEKLNSYKPEIIKFVNPDFTHHDAHAYSVRAFFNHHCAKDKQPKMHHTLVVDGFGNDAEVLSLYVTINNDQPKLIHRVYGHDYSLGLFYQYATSFVGMKENQDEYKFLGYEAHIDEYLSVEQIDTLDYHVGNFVEYFTSAWDTNTRKTYSDLLESLARVKSFWHTELKKCCESIGLDDSCSFVARCAVAYVIQQTCEIALSQFVKKYEIVNLLVAGGTFYNVKLNNKLLTTISGLFCVMPLAGDQGAAIGMYEAEDKKYAPAFTFDSLAWGKRNLYNFEKYVKDDIHYSRVKKDDMQMLCTLAEMIATFISNGRIVDVVFGNMEFGPRALGNTSTLFLPTVENTAHNNRMNHRNEVMPCAPICTTFAAMQLFDKKELARVVGSDKFMICTHNYSKPYSNQYGGVMHHKTLDSEWTGRPQIVRPGTFMDVVLTYVRHATDAKCLVNTSFNAHGNPIVFDTKDIIDNFNFQCEHADAIHKPELFVIDLYE